MLYALLGIAAAFCAYIQWGDEIPVPYVEKNQTKQEAKYIHNVNKRAEKEKYERTKMSRTPSGYMTVEEYEELSAPKDRMTMEVEIPKIPTPADMVYVPQPNYKIARYNNPPGSPEITITNTLYKRWQQNAQGIVSPDFKRLVYPSVYYYPNSGSTACDLFVINLEEAKSNMDRILTANTVHRLSEPILSTEKTNDNYFTFRTLTPVDFTPDGTKLLVKEKIGNTRDGIWKTTPIVYDFSVGNSYSLADVRDAIVYYWKETKGLNLNDKRWDIYPLGFSSSNPDWVVVNAVAYTGNTPVNLGVWIVTAHGERPRLMTMDNSSTVQIGMNGYKLVKDGVVAPSITEKEEQQLKRIEKASEKQKKAEDKAELKALKNSYKAKIKEMNAEFKESQKDYALREKIQSSTSGNEAIEKYKELGAEIEEFSLDIADYSLATYYIIAPAEASSNLGRFDGIRYGYRTPEYSNLKEIYKKSRSEGFGTEVKRRIILGTYVLSSGYYDAYYKKAQKVRTVIKQEFEKLFEKFDMLLTPTSPTVAYKIGTKSNNPLEMYLADLCTVSVNIAGLPGMSIPCGMWAPCRCVDR